MSTKTYVYVPHADPAKANCKNSFRLVPGSDGMAPTSGWYLDKLWAAVEGDYKAVNTPPAKVEITVRIVP